MVEVVLDVGGEVSVPVNELATRGQAVLATRGAGKSWLAAVEAEQLIEAGYPVLILDVVGEYWSLKAKYPVVVFGGRHADVPLDPHIGREIAKAVLDRKLQAVVDLTAMRRADQPFFIADLATELYEYGLKVKTPCWLLIEEAQNFIPQVGNPPCKRPILDIVEMGRHAGVGYCLVSHRSATIDKTALGLADIVVFKRLTLPHDLAVVRDFFRGKDPQFVEVVKELPGLANDEALLYYPLKIKEPVKFKVSDRKTPHAAETPTLELRELAAAAEVSAISKELTEYFRQLIRRKVAERDETSELRTRLEELQKELDDRDRRIGQLEHDLEIAQRFKIELPPEILKIPGVTEKVEYLEKQLMKLYQTQLEKARQLEEENKALKTQLEAFQKQTDLPTVLEKLESLHGDLERLRKPFSSLLESLNSTASKTTSTIEEMSKLSKGFISLEEHKSEVEEVRREFERHVQALEKAEEWRLNPHIIIRMSRIVNEITQLTDTGKQVLKAAASTSPDVAFDEEQIALAVGRSPSTARQYLKQLSKLGWVRQVGRDFKNNIEVNITRKLKETTRPGQEEIPDLVIERCKKELLTFIRSL